MGKMLFNDLVDEYLSNIDCNSRSRDTYRRVLNAFKRWIVFEGKDITEIKRSDILAYKSNLLKNAKAERTIHLYMTVIRRLYEYAEKIGKGESIASDIHTKNLHGGFLKEHLTEQEANKLLSSITRDSITGRRNFAIVNLLLRTGMRCVEVSRLRVCDIIELSDGSRGVRIQRKGDCARTETIGVPAKAIEPVLAYIAERNIEDIREQIFITRHYKKNIGLTPSAVSRIVKGIMGSAGVYSKTKTAHSLRHTAFVTMISHGASIKEVQILAGHKSMATTEIYLKSMDNVLRLKNPASAILDDVFLIE
ncbi:Tyrosine recombinase XerD [Bacteroidales bacterium Barb6XT]|nr:Tyrosine recombinase XerD [Bacteroidales bacterium Barb6XT]